MFSGSVFHVRKKEIVTCVVNGGWKLLMCCFFLLTWACPATWIRIVSNC